MFFKLLWHQFSRVNHLNTFPWKYYVSACVGLKNAGSLSDKRESECRNYSKFWVVNRNWTSHWKRSLKSTNQSVKFISMVSRSPKACKRKVSKFYGVSLVRKDPLNHVVKHKRNETAWRGEARSWWEHSRSPLRYSKALPSGCQQRIKL